MAGYDRIKAEEGEMKIVRYLAAFLLLLTGLLHVISVIRMPSDKNAVSMLIFGIIYFAVGLLLLFKVKYSSLAGLILPLIGLGSSFIVLGFRNLTPMLTILYAIDAAIIICCFALVLKRDANPRTRD
jgi:uncharacterized membrane protein HdeD (DUF308 family)